MRSSACVLPLKPRVTRVQRQSNVAGAQTAGRFPNQSPPRSGLVRLLLAGEFPFSPETLGLAEVRTVPGGELLGAGRSAGALGSRPQGRAAGGSAFTRPGLSPHPVEKDLSSSRVETGLGDPASPHPLEAAPPHLISSLTGPRAGVVALGPNGDKGSIEEVGALWQLVRGRMQGAVRCRAAAARPGAAGSMQQLRAALGAHFSIPRGLCSSLFLWGPSGARAAVPHCVPAFGSAARGPRSRRGLGGDGEEALALRSTPGCGPQGRDPSMSGAFLGVSEAPGRRPLWVGVGPGQLEAHPAPVAGLTLPAWEAQWGSLCVHGPLA